MVAQQDPLTHREIETLNQSIRDLNVSIRELQSKMETTYVRKDVMEPRLLDIEKDVATHQEWFTWLVRIVLAAVILALLGTVLVQGGGLT